eukprot:22211-Eustigmatos_ZCMA.PRE.1
MTARAPSTCRLLAGKSCACVSMSGASAAPLVAHGVSYGAYFDLMHFGLAQKPDDDRLLN